MCPRGCIVLCSDADPVLPSNADIEDLFDPSDYLRLFNWAFKTSLVLSNSAATNERILKCVFSYYGWFDHALPAHALTDHREEFFASIQPLSVARFRALFTLLNATLTLK